MRSGPDCWSHIDFRNVTRSTTRFVRALSLPTEDLVTVAASGALAEVAAAEELSLATELPRLPPVVKFPVRSVAMSPDRSAGGSSLIN